MGTCPYPTVSTHKWDAPDPAPHAGDDHVTLAHANQHKCQQPGYSDWLKDEKGNQVNPVKI